MANSQLSPWNARGGKKTQLVYWVGGCQEYTLTNVNYTLNLGTHFSLMEPGKILFLYIAVRNVHFCKKEPDMPTHHSKSCPPTPARIWKGIKRKSRAQLHTHMCVHIPGCVLCLYTCAFKYTCVFIHAHTLFHPLVLSKFLQSLVSCKIFNMNMSWCLFHFGNYLKIFWSEFLPQSNSDTETIFQLVDEAFSPSGTQLPVLRPP